MPQETTFSDSAGNDWSQPLPAQVQAEMAACAAIDHLSISLQALATAQKASNEAPGLLGLPDELGHRTEACELRDRWAASALLVDAAVAAVRRDGQAVIDQVKTMLAIE